MVRKGHREDTRKREGVSLSYEIAMLTRSVDAAQRTLTDADAADASEAHLRQAEASAVLAMVGARLRLLGRVLRGESDARSLLEPHNVSPVVPDDVILTSQVTR